MQTEDQPWPRCCVALGAGVRGGLAAGSQPAIFVRNT
jgi:hypothetical protein